MLHCIILLAVKSFTVDKRTNEYLYSMLHMLQYIEEHVVWRDNQETEATMKKGSDFFLNHKTPSMITR